MLWRRSEIQNVTYSSVRNDNLENSISWETTQINESEWTGQEHDTLTWLIGNHVNNTSGENSTKQIYLNKIDTEDKSLKVHAVINCVVTILGCLNLIYAVKTGYKCIHMNGKIQITDSTNDHPLYYSVETQHWYHTNNPNMGSNRGTADRKFQYCQIFIRHKSRATEECVTHSHQLRRR